MAVSGSGAPGGEQYQEAIGALYAMAYTVKMSRKKDGLGDYVIGKLEGLYRFGDKLEEMQWTLLIRTPEVVGQSDLESARAKLQERGKDAGSKKVSLRDHPPKRYVQALHVGPYDKEQETVEKMAAFAEGEGLEATGEEHHEIYLSDPRRVAPEKLKTILRMAVR